MRGCSHWLGLRTGTADLKVHRRPRQLGRWRHKLHLCMRQHVQSCPSCDAHVRPESASPRAELERFQHRTSLSRREKSLSTHAELAQLQHWPCSPPSEVIQYATHAVPHTTGHVHDNEWICCRVVQLDSVTTAQRAGWRRAFWCLLCIGIGRYTQTNMSYSPILQRHEYSLTDVRYQANIRKRHWGEFYHFQSLIQIHCCCQQKMQAVKIATTKSSCS